MERLSLKQALGMGGKNLLYYFWYNRDYYFGDNGDKDSEKHVMNCHCGVEKIETRTSTELVCPKCGLVDDVCNYVFSYDDFKRCNIYKKCGYKRKGNFNIILNQFLCTRIQIKVPDKVIKTLRNEINNRENILYNYTIPLSIPIVECLLKRNKLMFYKTSIFYIYFKLMNQPPPYLTWGERDQARNVFDVVSRLYRKYGASRKNFLSYYFVLKNIFIILGKNDLAKYIPQLKSLSRQKELERIWELITKDPEWVEALQKQRIV